MIVSPANRGDLVVPILIEQLKQIGVTLTPTSVTRPAQIAGLQAGTYDMYYIEYRGFARDPFRSDALVWLRGGGAQGVEYVEVVQQGI